MELENHVIVMLPREQEIFFRLLCLRGFQPGTIDDIARQLDGSKRTNATKTFIERMIANGCLNYAGVRPAVHCGLQKESPIYSRDKAKMRKFWEKTIGYHTSEKFYTLISLPGFEIG